MTLAGCWVIAGAPEAGLVVGGVPEYPQPEMMETHRHANRTMEKAHFRFFTEKHST